MFRASKTLAFSFCLALFLLTAVEEVLPQSLDARVPTPVRRNDVTGRIAARDIGDARLTDHFYAFNANPGDLVITIESQNLNGDIDVFTAAGLRPVLKVSLYAEAVTPVTKSVYLRQHEELIIRVEARSPNDEDGTYHLRFGGSFEPIAGVETPEETAAQAVSNQPAARKGKRVSSAGARIEEPAPPPEVASAPTPEPTPAAAETPPAEPKVEAPSEVTPKAAEAPIKAPAATTTARTRAGSRRGRSRQAPGRESTARSTTAEATPKSEAVKENEPTAAKVEETPARANAEEIRKSPADTKRSESKSIESAPAESLIKGSRLPIDRGENQPGEARSRLIIEMLDGKRIERFLNTVHEVTIESGEIVITLIDGQIERVRLARVMRMSIGP